MLYGGYQMVTRRSYPWSVAAAIIGIISCSLLGFPIGIWALIMLARQDGKTEFGLTSTPLSAPAMATASGGKFWRFFWMFLACTVMTLILVSILAVVTAVAVPALSRSHQPTENELQDTGIEKVSGQFQRDFTNTVPFAAHGRLLVDGVNGRVEIRGWTNDTARRHW